MKKNLILLGLSLCMGLVLMEIAVRVFMGQNPNLGNGIDPFVKYLNSDPSLGYTIKPNQDFSRITQPEWTGEGYKTNSDGLFDYEHGEKRGIRILALGDSFFQGYGVPYAKSVLPVLEEITGVEVVKGGIQGYGTWQELMLLRRIYPKYKPDIVLLGFCLWNDVQDNIRWSYSSGQGHTKTSVLLSSEGIKARALISKMKENVKRSALVNLTLDRMKYFAWIRRILFKYQLVENNVPEECQAYARNYSKDWEWAWKKTFEALQETAQLARQNGSRFVVVIIPTLTQVHPEAWERVRNYYFLEENEYDPDKPVRILSDFCRQNDILVANLVPYFREAGKTTFLYINHRPGAHWNLEGNALAARGIKEFLLGKSLIPGKES